MTGLPLSRKASIASATSRSLARPAPPMPPRSRYKALMRRSSLPASIASTRSRNRVSLGSRRKLSASARSSGSPLSCSTIGPCGAMTSAARSGTRGIGREKIAQNAPKSSNSRTRCRTLRSPSRPCQTQRSIRPIARNMAALPGSEGVAGRRQAPRTAAIRPSLRCARPCPCGHAGSTAWRGARCRGASR